MIKFLGDSLNHQTLILGNGPCAVAAAESLLAAGENIIIATKDDTCNLNGSVDSASLQILRQMRCLSCKGSVGNFKIHGIQKNKPVAIDAVVLSTQHSDDIDTQTLREAVMEEIIKPVLPAEWLTANTKYHINPTGRFVIGGPVGD